MKKSFFLFIILLAGSLNIVAQQKVRLFHFERSTNENIVCYDANIKGGIPDAKDPVVSYWSKLSDQNNRSELTFFDKIAFGHKVKRVSAKEYLFTLRASSKKTFKLCLHNGKWIATTPINGHEARVTKLYVKMKSKMTAEYVDVYGIDLATNKAVKERLKN